MGEKLGQHFLINQSAIKKIIAALDLQPNDTIIEIGPGRGALTLPLVRECSKIDDRDDRCKIIAIEKDKPLAKKLVNSNWKLDVIEGDVLKVLPKLFSNYHLPFTNYKVVGNIPYYITGKLLRILGELENKPEIIVLTIQKEVAERICAHPPKINPTHRKCPMCGMNLLAAAVQIWAEPEIISYLKPQDFRPEPKVSSAIIQLKPGYNKTLPIGNDLLYYRFVKAVFKQPRKTVLNNLSTGLGIPKEKALEMLKRAGLEGTERPQNLSLSQALQMSRLLQ